MHPTAWLEAAFGSEARIRILRFLVGEPPVARTEREIAAAIGMSPNAVNKAIRSLEEAGLVATEPIGRAHAVRLAPQSALFEALKKVFASEAALWELTVQAIVSALPAGAACYVFGSTARGSVRGDSDVDLLVITRGRKAAAEAAYAIEMKAGATIPARFNVIALSARDAAKRLRRPGVVSDAVRHGERLTELRAEDLVSA